MRLSLLILFCLFFGISFGQNDTTKYFKSVDYGWNYRRLYAREALVLPSDTIYNKLGFVSLNGKLYTGNGVKWSLESGTIIDTNRYVKYIDTAAMLAPYAKSIQLALKLNSSDTASLSNRINLKIDSLKKSNDSVYAYKNGIRTFQFKDSSGGTTIDTTSLSNRINQRIKYTDSATMLSPYINSVNYGLTKSGQTLSVDTSKISTLYQNGLKLNISDTINKWVGSVTSLNDSTIRVVKDGTTTDITIKSSATVTSATKLITQVYNKTGATITKGSVVYINGKHSSGLPSITLSLANNEANSYKSIGIVQDDIPTSNSGYIIQAGLITGLNLPTSTYTDGDLLYLSPTIPGGYTITKPLAPNHIVKIGTIINAHPTNGQIEIKIENGWQLDEMSDVKIATLPTDSAILQFSRVDSLWHDVNPTTAMGNRFVKISDTASMLSPYVRSITLNGYLQKSDSTIYQTKYRSDSARTNIYSGISSKLNSSDSTIYQTKYRSDTARIQTYSSIANKLNISDTSAMLLAYHRKADSATYQTKYGVDTARTNIYSGISSKLNTSDSTIYYSKYRSDTSRTNIYSGISGKFTLPSLTSGSVLFSNGITISQNNSSFFWDNTNTRLGIGTSSPGYSLDVQGSVATTAGNIVVLKNTNAALATSPVLALDCSGTQPDQQVDIRLGSTQPKGLRIYASNADLAASPAGAGFQFFSTSSTNFPGQIYFDGGAHNSSSIIFRTAQTSGNITQRMRIFANGNVSVSSSATDPGFLFNVAGTGKFTSTLTTAGEIVAFSAKTGAYTLTATDEVISADATSAGFNITLPTAVSKTGQVYTIKRINSGANNVTVATTSSQTIDGATTYVLSAQYKYVTVVSNGSNWLITANN